MTDTASKIGNLYGAALTAQEIVGFCKDERAFHEAAQSRNNLSMRFYLQGRGFTRIPRAFADDVINLAAR